MKKRTISIISELAFILIGIFFIVSAMGLRKTANYYESPALYPVILSVALIITALVALYNDTLGKHKNDNDVLDIPNVKGLGIALCTLVGMKLVWQFTDLFYVAVYLGVWTMLFCFHNIQKERRQRLIFATLGSAVFSVAAYVIFTLLLTIKF